MSEIQEAGAETMTSVTAAGHFLVRISEVCGPTASSGPVSLVTSHNNLWLTAEQLRAVCVQLQLPGLLWWPGRLLTGCLPGHITQLSPAEHHTTTPSDHSTQPLNILTPRSLHCSKLHC